MFDSKTTSKFPSAFQLFKKRGQATECKQQATANVDFSRWIESVTEAEWWDWKWQLRNSAKTQRDFANWFHLEDAEIKAFSQGQGLFKVSATPYYLSLINPHQINDPIRRMTVPRIEEIQPNSQAQEMLDPLGEREHNPQARVIHRYSDRALLLVTDTCGVYCRYCTRKHFTGKDQAFLDSKEFDCALKYYRQHPEIREVILSGGDPLSLSDAQLGKVLTRLREIPSIEIIRLGTRLPAACPQRITRELIETLKPHQPLFIMSHLNHPSEITAESSAALQLLVDNGFPVMNQMVLLNGVNNDPALVQALSRRLLLNRVKPYYMFQCDPSIGTDHLRTSIDESLAIQKSLWGHLSGLAMPTLSVDIPQGGGKAYMVPQFEIERSEKGRLFRGWDGRESWYLNPSAEIRKQPEVQEEFQAEWDLLRRENGN